MRETMIRKLLYYFVMAGLILMCMSCQLKEDQMGYPRTVTFSKEGGEKIIKGGQVSPLFIGRHWDSDAFSYPEDGYETVRYKWLTARVPLDNYSMIIINAEPNNAEDICLFRLSVRHDRGEAGVITY